MTLKKLGDSEELLKGLESLKALREWGEQVKRENGGSIPSGPKRCNQNCGWCPNGYFTTPITRDASGVCNASGLCACGLKNKRERFLEKDLERAGFSLNPKSKGFLNSIKESRELLGIKESIILSGPAGTGKTTIGLSMMFKSLINPPHQRIEYLTHYQYLSACKTALKTGQDFDLPARLILDEFMFKCLTDFELEKTFSVINYYQDKKRRVIIITNRTKEELLKALPPNIIDRLKTLKWIDHEGESRREKKW